MGKITVEVKINTFGTMLYSLNHPTATFFLANIILLEKTLKTLKLWIDYQFH